MWPLKHFRNIIVILSLLTLLISLLLLGRTCTRELACYSRALQVSENHRRLLRILTSQQSSNGDRGDSDMNMYVENINGHPVHQLSYGGREMNDDNHNAESLPAKQQSSFIKSKLTSSHLTAPLNTTPPLNIPSSGPRTGIPESASAAMLQFHDTANDNCSLPHCQDYLSNYDWTCNNYCLHRFKGRVKSTHYSGMQGECRFMRGEGRAAVALASLPGSGNTWIRGLLEKATGICTGSVYCDLDLKKAGFNGEVIRSGSVLVVKTHRTNTAWTYVDKPEVLKPWTNQPSYGAAILLIRNPYHALVAEWNREVSRGKHGRVTTTPVPPHEDPAIASHIGAGDLLHFGNNSGWNEFIPWKMKRWCEYIEHFILEVPPGRFSLLVRYEDFQRDRVREVSHILDFLYFPYTHEALAKRLKEDFDMFRRNRHADFEAFTESQEHYVEQQLREILDRLTRENNGVTFRIEEYLRHHYSN